MCRPCNAQRLVRRAFRGTHWFADSSTVCRTLECSNCCTICRTVCRTICRTNACTHGCTVGSAICRTHGYPNCCTICRAVCQSHSCSNCFTLCRAVGSTVGRALECPNRVTHGIADQSANSPLRRKRH